MRFPSAFLVLCLLLPTPTAVGAVIYVDVNSPGPKHDGTSWDKAFLRIRDGADAAQPNDEVWVADGTYTKSVLLREGVAVYGGFLGAEEGGRETSRDQRDFVNHLTIIDGSDMGAYDGSCVAMTANSRVDGFIITKGKGTMLEEYSYGGGVWCYRMGATGAIVNNIIIGNAADRGGGIACDYLSAPLVTDNTIVGNTATYGGGIYCCKATPTITNNTIADNTAQLGAGIYASWSTLAIAGNAITGNSSTKLGGGLYCYHSSMTASSSIIADNTADRFGGGMYMQASTLTMANSIVRGNRAWMGGGLCLYHGSAATLTNNTFAGNIAENGRAIGCDSHTVGYPNHADVANCILWNGGGEVWIVKDSSADITYSDVQGGYTGEGNIEADPLFVDPASGDLHLSPGAPCIDTGSNDAAAGIEYDFEGDPRILDGDADGTDTVDMGADEYRSHGATPQPPFGFDPDWWTNVDGFKLTWTNPEWPHAWTVLHYTVDDRPLSDTDGRTAPISYDPGPSAIVTVEVEGQHKVWIWLEDELGQMDYTSATPAPSGAEYLKLDLTPPANPTVDDSDPPMGTWSSKGDTAWVHWDGAQDTLSGVGGYSYDFTRSESTVPDEQVDTTGNEATSAPLAEGLWWFHLRTVDQANDRMGLGSGPGDPNEGNWTPGLRDATLHFGPIGIDRTPPEIRDGAISPPEGVRGEILTVTAKISDRDAGVDPALARCYIHLEDGTPIADAAMYDDGTHGDAAAGDGVYTGQVDSAGCTPTTYSADIEAGDLAVPANTVRVYDVASFTITAPGDILGDTWRVNVSSLNAQGNGDSGGRSMNEDGRYVVFWSNASNLVPGDTNNTTDIFVHDRLTGRVERLSLSTGGVQGNKSSWRPRISLDGEYIVFASNATNLVGGDTNGQMDVFVHHRVTGETERVSVSSTGEQANGRSWRPNISGDGRYVSFASDASNLVPDDTNGMSDVFVHDCATGETTRVSVSSAGEQGDGTCEFNAVSADGRYVTFQSKSKNLVPDDTNNAQDIFVRDLVTNETERVSVSSGGEQADKGSWRPEISGDGRYVAFVSDGTNLAPGDTNGAWDTFVRDRTAGTTERVSVDSEGSQGNGESGEPQISADGRWVIFRSSASNMVPGDTNGITDIFVHDRAAGTTVRVSVSAKGDEANGGSDDPSISADGRYAAFRSVASNLVPDDTNGCADSHVRKVLAGDVVVSAPEGWLNAGWNWLSIPLDPAGWPEASHLLGFDCQNHLYGWDSVTKAIRLYPDDLRYLVRGQGYLLRLSGDERPSYDALAPVGGFEIPVPEAGWTWIGQPFDHSTLLSRCSIRNNTTGQVRTAQEDSDAADGWIGWDLPWWDSAADSWRLTGLEGGDDDSLRPWRGYLVWANARDLTLILPAD